jgi:ParB family transcriptional regulator, chromosome partitioning protein
MATTRRTKTKEAAPLLGPASVPTNSLRPNPHNPRMLFDELPLKTLEESIAKVGILVPLTVFKAKGSDKFTILDGQRRWICAQRLKLPNIPINQVAEPSVATNIVTMFQIHKLRKDWELMPTALKLGVLMEELKEKRDRQLSELTGLELAVVTRCKKLLWYPEKYQEMMLFSDPDDRVKADFFIELYPVINDSIVRADKSLKTNVMIDSFLNKYQNRLSGFKAITDFRKIKQYFAIARAAGQDKAVLQKFRRLLSDDNVDYSTLEIDVARIHREASGIIKRMSDLRALLDDLDVDSFVAEEELWDELEILLRAVKKKLSDADRRLQ